MNGHEILKEIKSDPGLKHIPVIMLTTSSAEQDITRAYLNHANAYVTKSSDLDEYFNKINALKTFWFQVAKLPRGKNAA